MIRTAIREFLDDMQFFSYEKMTAEIDKYDEISFDIFDTLIKRDTPDPKGVFEIVEFNSRERGFAQKRIQAEQRARTIKGEVTLEEIYAEMEGITEDRKKELMDIEISHEINVCTINLNMYPVYLYACQHKRVFLASDMYLSQQVIERILKKNGIVGYEALIISNEVDKSKSDGSMYAYIIDNYHCKNLLHIGNSIKADYVMARRHGASAIKIKTNTRLLGRKYRRTKGEEKNEYLEAFLSNRHDDTKGYFYNFGFERFGPALFGFTRWLFEEMKRQNIKQVLFMARDGYIMQKAYHVLGYNEQIPDQYFEASRRSLRVPAFLGKTELKDLIKLSSLSTNVSIELVMESFGLEIPEYSKIIEKYGYNEDKRFNAEEMASDKQFNAFYNEIKDDIQSKAHEELNNLLQYLSQFDFSDNTAMVDIGWRGTMQNCLHQMLKEHNIDNNVMGFYFGLRKESKELLGDDQLSAEGYLFDCLNNDNASDIVLPYRSLFETFFLEQKGSVKCYEKKEDMAVAIRYKYEYEEENRIAREAKAVNELQEGALDFIREIKQSKLFDYIGYNAQTMFQYIHQTGLFPCVEDVKKFGCFRYYDTGKTKYLAQTKRMTYYIAHMNIFKQDLFDARWKTGFLKGILKVPIAYDKLFVGLMRIQRKMSTIKLC